MRYVKRKKISHFANCFPNPEQECLLRACIFTGEASLQAWHRWRSIVDLDEVDWASFRLLPYLYRNLSLQGVQDPLLGKLKGIYRFNWARNQKLFHRSSLLLKTLHEHSIETILLKGGAMSLFYYKDPGLRYMDDFDFLVKFSDGPKALELILSQGWTQELPTLKLFNPHGHAKNFRESKNVGIDLHWHLLSRCFSEADSEPFWEGSTPVKIGEVPTRILAPADQLLQLCVHGAAWNGVAPIRWITDAMVLLRQAGDRVDWDRLLDNAERLKLSVPLGETLRYLSETFSAPIPQNVLENLLLIPVEGWQIREYKSEIRTRKWLGEFPYHWHRYHRSPESKVHRLKPYGFVHYLKNYLGMENIWQVSRFLASSFFQKAEKNIFKSASFSINKITEIRP